MAGGDSLDSESSTSHKVGWHRVIAGSVIGTYLNMKDQTQVVVIGGGLVGCSILYHLTKLGWSDVMLIERDELTSGSTWHAAANIHGLHDNNNITRIQHYTMNLYAELEKETGQSCGVFQLSLIHI